MPTAEDATLKQAVRRCELPRAGIHQQLPYHVLPSADLDHPCPCNTPRPPPPPPPPPPLHPPRARPRPRPRLATCGAGGEVDEKEPRCVPRGPFSRVSACQTQRPASTALPTPHPPPAGLRPPPRIAGDGRRRVNSRHCTSFRDPTPPPPHRPAQCLESQRIKVSSKVMSEYGEANTNPPTIPACHRRRTTTTPPPRHHNAPWRRHCATRPCQLTRPCQELRTVPTHASPDPPLRQRQPR